jgi:hypothetical protein
MSLESTGVIHADATVIAGLLILGTILQFKPPETVWGESDRATLRRLKIVKRWHYMVAVALAGILPFSISAIIVIFGPIYLALYAMAAGFGYLIVTVVIIAIYSVLRVRRETKEIKERQLQDAKRSWDESNNHEQQK